MATISISNLSATGADLFADSESYLNELTDSELNETKGGSLFATAVFVIGVAIGYQATKAVTAVAKKLV
ncbi:hypothetical protein DSM106972_081580 [Dulcicalothrix desertica PCC 7102]|jgi:hypothetical protein|uniref:Bacteriocin n=1 Tax=Dulcicalothrix desertica PCC 7102 TaxID=232991 RepID=A0A3S1IK60_9CYAN|nr:hypothetical protein [Dulcicalothrix desertica]RUS98529.1 hypothetical protein DSM106972_081580 [Dulcicalothrix desertica PCC 7102]TWH54933.1 hypothetical protein CAL7102_03020 [Dulcicalothrix desertica PCC 7102]